MSSTSRLVRVGATVRPLVGDDPRSLGGHVLLGRLGEGGQGVVYLAQDARGTRVALKTLLPGEASDATARRRLATELRMARRVPVTCTARMLTTHLDHEPPFLVTEFVDGPTLSDWVHAHGPLAGYSLEKVMLETLVALEGIHRAGVVHRDIKPGNVVLGPAGPVLVDFGIAVLIRERHPDEGNDGVLGSAAYLAPERLDAGLAQPASDIFGWAATMVFAATVVSPFGGADQAAVLESVEHRAPRLGRVPLSVRPLLAACLLKDPRRRPTTAQAVADLRAALVTIPEAPPPVRPSVRRPLVGPGLQPRIPITRGYVIWNLVYLGFLTTLVVAGFLSR